MNPDETTRNGEAALAEKLKQHHATMVKDLDRLSAAFVGAAGSGPEGARSALAEWIEHVLIPHAEEEEETSYRAAAGLPAGRLLIDAMVAEHVLIRRLVALFATTDDPVAAAAYGRAVFEVFTSHQNKENDIILPMLVADESVSLIEVMGAVHTHSHDHHAIPHA